MTITKQKLIRKINDKQQLPKKQSVDVLESILESMKSTLESGEDILITGFGKFCVHKKNARRGRNPQNGEDLALDSRQVVKFKPSKVLLQKLNENG